MKIKVNAKPTKKTLSDTLAAIGKSLPAASKYRDALIDKSGVFTLNFRVDIALKFIEGVQRSVVLATVRSLIDRGLYKELPRQYVLDKDLPDGLLLDCYSGVIAGTPMVKYPDPVGGTPTFTLTRKGSHRALHFKLHCRTTTEDGGLNLEIDPPKKSDIEDIQSMCRLMRVPTPTPPVITDLWDRPNPLVDPVDGISLGADTPDHEMEVSDVDHLGDVIRTAVLHAKDLGRRCIVLATFPISSTLVVPDYQLVPFCTPGDVVAWMRDNPEAEGDKLIPISSVMRMLTGYRFPPMALDIIVVTNSRLPRVIIWQLRGRVRPEPARVIELRLKKDTANA